jgi:hypothetical protein
MTILSDRENPVATGHRAASACNKRNMRSTGAWASIKRLYKEPETLRTAEKRVDDHTEVILDLVEDDPQLVDDLACSGMILRIALRFCERLMPSRDTVRRPAATPVAVPLVEGVNCRSVTRPDNGDRPPGTDARLNRRQRVCTDARLAMLVTAKDFPTRKGATPTRLLARHPGKGQGRSDRPAEWPAKDASGGGRKSAAAEHALGRVGRLGSHQDVTDRPIGGDCDRQSFACLAPHGDVYGLAVAVDEAVGPSDAYNVAGLESRGHVSALLFS